MWAPGGIVGDGHPGTQVGSGRWVKGHHDIARSPGGQHGTSTSTGVDGDGEVSRVRAGEGDAGDGQGSRPAVRDSQGLRSAGGTDILWAKVQQTGGIFKSQEAGRFGCSCHDDYSYEGQESMWEAVAHVWTRHRCQGEI